MTKTLEIGAKIRCINDYSIGTTVGNVYTIAKVVGDGAGGCIYHYQDDDRNADDMETIGHDYLRNIFEVVEKVAMSGTQAERIEAVCDEVRDLLIRKNHDYGDSFSKQFAKYGVLSGLIRMDDKMARLDTLVNGKQAQVAESLEDSVADLAGYALLTLVELRKGASR